MFVIRKKFKFEMAHQLDEAYSTACSEQIHGHSYICEVFFASHKLDGTGMVIDFTMIKDKIKAYIDSWDHCIVMPASMPKEYLDCMQKYNRNFKRVPYNPTAENMAKDMFEYINKLIPSCFKVRLHETDTGYAEYYEEFNPAVVNHPCREVRDGGR